MKSKTERDEEIKFFEKLDKAFQKRRTSDIYDLDTEKQEFLVAAWKAAKKWNGRGDRFLYSVEKGWLAVTEYQRTTNRKRLVKKCDSCGAVRAYRQHDHRREATQQCACGHKQFTCIRIERAINDNIDVHHHDNYHDRIDIDERISRLDFYLQARGKKSNVY